MKKSRIFITLVFSSFAAATLTGCNNKSNFDIRFVNYDDTLLLELKGVEKGAEVKYNLARPVHFDDASNYYVFKGWDKEITVANADVTYKAEYDAYPLTNVPEDPVAYTESLPEKTSDGMTLHAFCWSYKDIEEQLPFIEGAGYKAVQIMPVQVPKSGGTSWWAFYQPLGFQIADGEESPLGTKAELTSMCQKAEERGISIIADIVFNHLANVDDDHFEPDGTPMVYSGVEAYEPYIYQHRNDETNPTFHHIIPTSGCGSETQHYPYSVLPDINTAHPKVQERALDLLKECIDVGIDGFRFDAAKHIETPDDPEYASDFWPNTLGVAKEYYKGKTGKDLFAYGEVLGTPYGRKIDVYTKLMNVNDDAISGSINYGISNQEAWRAVEAQYKTSNPAELVGMLETHDSYLENPNPFSNDFTAKGWSALASRKDYRGLYFARPDSQASPTVGAISDYYFRDENIGAVNRFHNRFVGAEEALSSDGSIFINERYSATDKGAIVTNFGTSKKIVVDFTKLGTAVYYDQVSGKAVTVRNGHATIELDDSGIAVLTRSKNGPLPELDIKDRNALFVDDKSVEVTYDHATSATYTINGGAPVAFESGDKITFNKSQAVDGLVKLKVIVANDNKTYSEEVTYKVATVIPGYFNIVNVSEDHLTNYEIYMWSWKKGGAGKWSKDYTIQGGIILVDTDTLQVEGMVFGRFEKDYVIENVNEWDYHVIKQTSDIRDAVLAQGYYDGTNF